MTKFFNVIGEISVYAAALIAILYCVGFLRYNKTYRIFCVYLIAMALIQVAAQYVGRGNLGESNLYISHYYYVLQFVLLSLFYHRLLKYEWIKWMILPVLGFVTIQFIRRPEMYYEYNSLGMIITHSLIVFYTMLFLYKAISSQLPFVISTIGIFLYLLSSSLIFATSNLILNLDLSQETQEIMGNTNRVLYFVFIIAILIDWYRNYNIIKEFIIDIKHRKSGQ